MGTLSASAMYQGSSCSPCSAMGGPPARSDPLPCQPPPPPSRSTSNTPKRAARGTAGSLRSRGRSRASCGSTGLLLVSSTGGLRPPLLAPRRLGGPGKGLPLVESIYSGKTLIFLFNFTDRQLHGVYIATSDGRENISLSAWKGSAPTPRTGRKDEATGLEVEDAPGDDEGSPFPAQCTFQLVEEFAPTPEAEFKHVLEYTERQRFKRPMNMPINC